MTVFGATRACARESHPRERTQAQSLVRAECDGALLLLLCPRHHADACASRQGPPVNAARVPTQSPCVRVCLPTIAPYASGHARTHTQTRTTARVRAHTLTRVPSTRRGNHDPVRRRRQAPKTRRRGGRPVGPRAPPTRHDGTTASNATRAIRFPVCVSGLQARGRGLRAWRLSTVIDRWALRCIPCLQDANHSHWPSIDPSIIKPRLTRNALQQGRGGLGGSTGVSVIGEANHARRGVRPQVWTYQQPRGILLGKRTSPWIYISVAMEQSACLAPV